VTGGSNSSGTLSSAELYDPSSKSFTPTGPLMGARDQHPATLLRNGKVLVAGGWGPNPDAELFDQVSGIWSPTGNMNTDRGSFPATRLNNGKVLVPGGYSGYPIYNQLASSELYDPAPPPQVRLPALLAFFPFEGNARDASGNDRHGVITGSPQPAPGYQGQAYLFNGTSDYITVPLDINPGKYPKLTMGGWAKTVSGWPGQQLLTHDNGDFDRSIGIDFRGNGIGWSAFCGHTVQVLGAMPAISGQWTFVAATYDQAAQTVKFQVDDMVFTKTGVTLDAGRNQLLIGASPMFLSYFAGVIDNVFVFSDALTDQHLAYICNGGAPAIMTATKRPNPGLLLLLMD